MVNRTGNIAMVAIVCAAVQAAGAGVVVVNIANWAPTEPYSHGEPTANPNLTLNLEKGAQITFIDLDINITGVGIPPDAWRLFFASLIDDTFWFTFSYGGHLVGLIDLSPYDFILPDGELYVEAAIPSALYPLQPGESVTATGTVAFHYIVPAPASLALLAVAGVVGSRRRPD